MLSSVVNGGGWLEEAFIGAGLIGVQAVCAVNTVFIASFLADGLDPFFLVTAGGFFSAFLLLPFAIALERKKWPEKLGLSLVVRFALIALGGIPVYQVFMLLGVKNTTPAVATAMPNLGPGLIFIIASCLRIEKFDIKCNYTRFKIMGTLICLCGAVTMALLQNPTVQKRVSSVIRSSIKGGIALADDQVISNEWMIGCFYLLAAVIALSCTMVLQAVTMVEFPSPLSLSVIASLMGSTFTGIFQFMSQGSINTGASSIGVKCVIYAALAGGSVTCISTGIVNSCVHKKGPVFVSVFHPTQTVCAAILSALILKQFVAIGSLAGMSLMFAGLYVVLWAKIKEAGEAEKLRITDEEKPLLC